MKVHELRRRARQQTERPGDLATPAPPPARTPLVEEMAKAQPALGESSFFISLHTKAPDGVKEASYAGYARVSAKLTPSGVTLANEDTVAFPTCVGGSEVITHLGVETPDGMLVGPLTRSIAVSEGITPSIPAGSLTLKMT